jgi:hypothetical protein
MKICFGGATEDASASTKIEAKTEFLFVNVFGEKDNH